jgi:hypothetical protein
MYKTTSELNEQSKQSVLEAKHLRGHEAKNIVQVRHNSAHFLINGTLLALSRMTQDTTQFPNSCKGENIS